jgi:hypothetical protein
MRPGVFFLALAIATTCASPPVGASAEGIASYENFVSGAEPQRGLLTVWHKAGKVYLELAASQLNHDFVQTIVPGSGIGGDGVVWGNTDHLPTEVLRFERAGNQVAIVWPSPYFVAPHSPAAQRAIAENFARTIVALAPIAAEDTKTGALVIDAAPFLEDQLNLKNVLKQGLDRGEKGEPYSLERDRTYFGTTKAFPKNVLIEAKQSWASPTETLDDRAPDPRHIQISVVYNIAEPPGDADYRPRYADDRIGIYDDIYLQYDNDAVLSRALRYIVRWNLQPSDPTKPLSPAKHPMVFTMSDTIPEAYRPAIKRAVLAWNAAFEKLGIKDALQVVDQPNDPNFDADDIRYNMLRWVTESRASFGADSQTLYDPRTGQEFRTGVLISADVPMGAERTWKYFVDPARNGRSTDPMPPGFLDDVWMSTILHETGHNLGMQHNFIGSRAYTAKELQDPAFTAKNGIASTVMEYAPTNLWPKSIGQGTYEQTVLGPYDYYTIHWAYAPIPSAATPEDEIPTLSSWAAAWSDPRYRYASDEDVSWADGHAADPRVEQGILSDDPMGWCTVQLAMDRDLIAHLDERYPQNGAAFEDETQAFRSIFGSYQRCAVMPERYLGGQYLSRAHRGDAHAEPPVVPVSRDDQYRAFQMLDKYVFSSAAFAFAPSLMQHLGYSEWAGYGYVSLEGYGNLPRWAYAPTARHDVSATETVGRLQGTVLDYLFAPATLARIADARFESTRSNPMQLGDLFAWSRASIFGELGGRPGAIDPLRRGLQHRYALQLVKLATAPAFGAPSDAQALAHAELAYLDGAAGRLAGHSRDASTDAHLLWLRDTAREALEGKR